MVRRRCLCLMLKETVSFWCLSLPITLMLLAVNCNSFLICCFIYFLGRSLPLKHHYALFFHLKCSFSSNIFSIQGILAHKLVHCGAFYLISVCSINLDSSRRIDACAIIRTSISLMESILLSNPQPISYIF